MTRALTARFGMLAAALAAALAFVGCLEDKLESAWPDREISIDGKNAEWAGREAYYSEQEAFKIGFCNDNRYLYVYLATWSRQKQMQILTNGLTVWIDRTGKKQRTFGVAYPMKQLVPDSIGAPDGMPAGLRGGERPGGRPNASEENRQAIARELLAEARSELTVVGTGAEPLASMAAADGERVGIDAMIDYANRTLIYELRIPLAASDSLPFAVGAAPGATIGVGFIVGKTEMPSMKGSGQRPPEGMPSGGGMGGSGGMGGPPGGGMGGPGGPGTMSVEPLEYWAKVKLAPAPAAAPTR
jgi:hypothetical protein